MATRFYFSNETFSTITPVVSGSWDFSIPAFARHPLEIVTSTGIMTTVSLDGNNDSADTDYCYNQWISDPIAAQTITSQTIEIQMRAMEEATRANQYLALTVRVLSNDGTSVRGTILALTRDGTELATSLTNRRWAGTSTQVIAQADDRIVIEVGTGGNPSPGSGGDSHDADIRIGHVAAADLPENDTATTDDNPWFEFTEDITFPSAGGDESVQFDGKLVVGSIEDTQFDGKLIVGSIESSQFDGLLIVKSSESTQFDGKLVIGSKEDIQFDGLLEVTAGGDESAQFDGKLVVVTIVDSYTDGGSKGRVWAAYPEESQSFLCEGNYTLDSVQFYMTTYSGPTGYAYAKIYAHSGTYGTSSVPTGAALATSEPVDVTELSALTWHEFEFTGVERIALSDSIHYCAVLAYDGSDGWLEPITHTTGTHDGNYARHDTSTWTPTATTDMCFCVYGIDTAGDKFAQFDGKLVVGNVDTPQFDGKLVIGNDEAAQFDGKLVVGSTESPQFDGKLYVYHTESPQFDGKLIVKSTASSQFDGKLIVSPGGFSAVDYYYNPAAYQAWLLSDYAVKLAQMFTCSADATLETCEWFMRRVGTLSGSVYAKIYGISGTYGTNAIPSGAALATSDGIDVTTLPTSTESVEFTFSGADRIALLASTEHYAVSIEHSGGDGDNYIRVVSDSDSPTHDGNWAYMTVATWSGSASNDFNFYVYGSDALGTDTPQFDGKLVVGSTEAPQFDGKLIVGNTEASQFDGKLIIGSTESIQFDGKLIVGSIESTQFDSKLYIYLIESTQFDGKVVIGSKESTQFDGLLIVESVGEESIQFDGKLVIGSIEDTQFDGKLLVGNIESTQFDSKLIVGSKESTQFDGKLVVGSIESIQFDGLLYIYLSESTQFDGLLEVYGTESTQFDGLLVVESVGEESIQFDGLLTVGSIESTQFDGKLIIGSTESTQFDGKLIVGSTESTQFNGKLIVKNSESIQFDSKLIVGSTESTQFDGLLQVHLSEATQFDGLLTVGSDESVQFDGLLQIVFAGEEAVKFDGKLVVGSTEFTQFDGKLDVYGSESTQFDGKLVIGSIEDTQFDGRLAVGSIVSTQFDGKLVVSSAELSRFDGKLEVYLAASIQFDGKLTVGSTKSVQFDVKLRVTDGVGISFLPTVSYNRSEELNEIETVGDSPGTSFEPIVHFNR